jgi:hypothetical protein
VARVETEQKNENYWKEQARSRSTKSRRGDCAPLASRHTNRTGSRRETNGIESLHPEHRNFLVAKTFSRKADTGMGTTTSAMCTTRYNSACYSTKNSIRARKIQLQLLLSPRGQKSRTGPWGPIVCDRTKKCSCQNVFQKSGHYDVYYTR